MVSVIRNSQDGALMLFDPISGREKPYPSEATQYREYHRGAVWLYNPWTGSERDIRDVRSDLQGLLIKPPGAI